MNYGSNWIWRGGLSATWKDYSKISNVMGTTGVQ
jgi:hypothetical protein